MLELGASDPDAYVGMSSVLNFTLLHHTVVGFEALEQMEMAGHWPDIIIGSVGGGSNFLGLAAPFLSIVLREKRKLRAIAAEPAACPSLTRGRYAYDFLDSARMGPVVKMHTLGSNFMPPIFHAGGLRWHGMAPLLSHLKNLGFVEAVALPQKACFEAGVMFARCEGIVPAPEANHAVRAAIDEALKCKEEGTARTILFNLSGHGNFDMQAYADYFAGKLEDRELDQKTLDAAFAELPRVAA
jgi:tryptophan synthase beta chain